MNDLEDYVIDVEETTKNNNYYRWVFQTSKEMQYVFMSIPPGEEIGKETHQKTTQFIRIEEGSGLAVIDGKHFDLEPNSSVFIPSGVEHNIINDGDIPLKLYTLYAPPNHKIGTLQRNKPAEDD